MTRWIFDRGGELGPEAFDRAVESAAHALAGKGVEAEDSVGVLCANTRGFAIAARAVTAIGANAHYLGTSWTHGDVARVVRDSHLSLLLHDDDHAATAAAVAAAVPRLNINATGAERCALALDGEPSGSHVLYTSGTTGTPKQVPQGQWPPPAGVVGLASLLPLADAARAVVAAPLFHAWGLFNLGLTRALSVDVALPDPFFDPRAILEALPPKGGVLLTVPAVLNAVVEVASRRDANVAPAAIVVAGSALPAGLVTRCRARFGDVLFSVYGSTEAGWVSLAQPDDLTRNAQSVGRPFPGVAVRLAEDGEVLVQRAVTGDAVATGDAGSWDERGTLIVHGRQDDLIVTGGENVWPSEVETALLSHPDVHDAHVFGEEDGRLTSKIVAMVVGDQLSASDLRIFLLDRLATSKMPHEIRVVQRIVRTATGKAVRLEK